MLPLGLMYCAIVMYCVVVLMCRLQLCMHCLEKVADLHMDMGDFPGKGARPSVVRLQDAVGHKFTMVSQTVGVSLLYVVVITTPSLQVAGC